MIVTLPSDVAAYTAWASACYAGTGSCSFDPVEGFPDNTVIYTWDEQGSTSNSRRYIYFEEGTPEGNFEVFAPITASFTVTAFELTFDSTQAIGVEYDPDYFGLPLTSGLPSFAHGAAALWENQNTNAFEYTSGEQFFTLEVARSATPDTWTHVFDTLSGFPNNARRLIAGTPTRSFLVPAGDPEAPNSASMTQFVDPSTLVPASSSLTINPGDSLRATFFRSSSESASPDDPHFVFGPLSFVFDTPEAEFWTSFNRTTEQAE